MHGEWVDEKKWKGVVWAHVRYFHFRPGGRVVALPLNICIYNPNVTGNASCFPFCSFKPNRLKHREEFIQIKKHLLPDASRDMKFVSMPMGLVVPYLLAVCALSTYRFIFVYCLYIYTNSLDRNITWYRNYVLTIIPNYRNIQICQNDIYFGMEGVQFKAPSI
jgi:hypothetical protein